MKKINIVIICLIVAIPYKLEAREFLNAFLHINFSYAYGWPSGDVIDFEHDSYAVTETYSSGTKTVRPDHYDSTYGLFLDFLPMDPIVLGREAHAIKFGIRGSYKFNTLYQEMTVNETVDSSKEYKGELFSYTFWSVGPVLYYAPSIQPSQYTGDYSAGGGFILFLQYGRVHSGKLTAYPVQREKEETVGDYETSITGYRIDMGLGGVVSVCSINLGLNFFYSIQSFTMDEQIYTDIGKDTSLSEYCVEVYMGIPIEWGTVPTIF